MQGRINGRLETLRENDVLGVGGEATVFKHGQDAVKIHLIPDQIRDAKLRAMLGCAKTLPLTVIAPRNLVFDPNDNRVIGFTMPLLTPDYQEIRRLSTKNYRAQSGLTALQIAVLFLGAHTSLSAIHRNGMVVGDLNDLNLMFNSSEIVFIDVDSFQFDKYPCMVGTEAFLDPALYNRNLKQGPLFQPVNDWYSFAVHLFKSLLLTHPYGGTHPKINTLIERAKQQVSVFDPAIIYPKIAYPLEVLSDDLANTFYDWFAKGRRDAFPYTVLENYLSGLTLCSFCHNAYPSNRSRCPFCSSVQALATLPIKGSRTVIRTDGKIVAWAVQNDTLYVIAHENGKAILYSSEGCAGIPKQLELFNAMPGATYAFLEGNLIVSPSPESDELMIVDVNGSVPLGVAQTYTTPYGNQGPMFDVNEYSLYRLSAGFLIRSQIRNGSLIEHPVLAVSDRQTWFKVSPKNLQRIFGFFRTLNTYRYWLLDGDNRSDVTLSALEPGEFVIETDAKFTTHTCLIVRRTQLNGVDRYRLDEIKQGQLIASRISLTGFDPIEAHAYQNGFILRSTDTGVVQESVNGTSVRAFGSTEPFVRQGDSLYPYRSGLLVVSDDKVAYIEP